VINKVFYVKIHELHEIVVMMMQYINRVEYYNHRRTRTQMLLVMENNSYNPKQKKAKNTGDKTVRTSQNLQLHYL
jgi:hypothetical protein